MDLDPFRTKFHTNGHVTLTLQIKPGAKRTEVRSIGDDGTIVIALKAKPIEGAANRALIASLAEVFDVPKSSIEIIKGHTARKKVVSIHSNDVAVVLNTHPCG